MKEKNSMELIIWHKFNP